MHTTALLSLLVLILLPFRAAAQWELPMECRPGCKNCVYACWAPHYWTPVGIDCSICQNCVLTSPPGCVARNKDPPVGDLLCTTLCGDGGLKASCLGYIVCADDEWIPPETSTTTWIQSPTPSPSPQRG
ncbi:hypothetical protein HD806DRAFT_144993 [Xylariaceae sp. AK1471]|nr:hypothetical protein HD806DRAFT_144993 [Xylariaceae sp. AK1471]